MCWRAELGDSIAFCPHVLHQDVIHLVLAARQDTFYVSTTDVLDLGSEVDVDLDSVLHILRLDRLKQRVEPFASARVRGIRYPELCPHSAEPKSLMTQTK